jgi:hypothetical protein
MQAQACVKLLKGDHYSSWPEQSWGAFAEPGLSMDTIPDQALVRQQESTQHSSAQDV